MAIEIVDFPIKKWWFSIAMLNYQRVTRKIRQNIRLLQLIGKCLSKGRRTWVVLPYVDDFPWFSQLLKNLHWVNGDFPACLWKINKASWSLSVSSQSCTTYIIIDIHTYRHITHICIYICIYIHTVYSIYITIYIALCKYSYIYIALYVYIYTCVMYVRYVCLPNPGFGSPRQKKKEGATPGEDRSHLPIGVSDWNGLFELYIYSYI